MARNTPTRPLPIAFFERRLAALWFARQHEGSIFALYRQEKASLGFMAATRRWYCRALLVQRSHLAHQRHAPLLQQSGRA